MTDQLFGFLNINKPSGMTSHDVVAKVRRYLRQHTTTKKVGHCGTLDPMATGVLILCVGSATRLSEYVMQSQKQYRATVLLGVETDTYDADGTVVATYAADHIERSQVESALEPFHGAIQQVPPMYSAIKRDGKKLYELARAGETVELEPRSVTIHHLEITEWNPPRFVLDVVCSSGTYIRSLAHDIGQVLNVGGHLTQLERTRSGSFGVDLALDLDAVLITQDLATHLVAPSDALTDWPTMQVTDEEASNLYMGRFIEKLEDDAAQTMMAYSSSGDLVAILENRGTHWKPHKVFNSN